MRVAIMQPTWLPWIGYFDLVDQVDLFVFLDTVQFCRQSWHCRNRIRTAQGSKWITLPVCSRYRDGDTLNSATVKAERRISKFIKTLCQEYRNAPAFDQEGPPLIEHLSAIRDGMPLSAVNAGFIRFAMRRLGIATETVCASELPTFEGRISRLIGICRHLGADTFVSTPGSAAYIGAAGLPAFEAAGVELAFQRYNHPVYPQCGSGFLSFMSIVDLLLDTGPDALEILRSGRQEPIPADRYLSLSGSVPVDAITVHA